ncbi:hypothetical protein KP509_13G020200 [Ceratopteris richardii]|uniref:Sodium/calcium exchanger membrane region domain-containing protein n=1 Tax=Ceratopteris richardii TaxID=49495 RepID=A0A8T2TDW9_CERRI|nr:hypothetical protein KP509_13G020200 [Ceratopteris richardii]
MIPRILIFLFFLTLQANLTVSFIAPPLNFSSSSDLSRDSLFSTYSLRPWSRASKTWHSWYYGANSTGLLSNTHYGNPRTNDFECSSDNSTLNYPVQILRDDCERAGKNTGRIVALALWILVLFYLLGTTASDYFSCTLEKLSQVLRLSPAVAGVTLLAIGNGAPDVFSSVAAFVSSDRSASIGFGSVLGGALFITTVVSGTVALVTARVCKKAGYEKINLVCFIRDALFLLASAGVLTVVLVDGKVHLWESIAFFCVYLVYAASVWAAEMLEERHGGVSSVLDPLIPRGLCSLPHQSSFQHQDYHYHIHSQDVEIELEYYIEGNNQHVLLTKCKEFVLFVYKYGIEWPLAVPRRITIPVIEEGRWSRPLAIISCFLAPIFVGGIYVFECNRHMESLALTLGISGGLGIILGLLAYLNTENERPPQTYLSAWLAAGFFMSVVWFYIVADELVDALETLGSIFKINPAILGLTVLAWGNSIGDLVADLALACNGSDGVQIAISGCYAGPLFNTVVGLGLSLVVACSKSYPEPLFISDDDGSLFFIIGFLGAGLAWALIMMPLKGMRLSRSFGAGLVLVYFGFLVTGVCYAMGWILR